MPTLADAIAANTRHNGPLCKVRTTRDALNKTDRATFDQALAGTASASALSRALRDLDIALPTLSIQRHRRGDCQCKADR